LNAHLKLHVIFILSSGDVRQHASLRFKVSDQGSHQQAI